MAKEIEHHPDWYYEISNMRTLVLGTFPPGKHKWSYEFYYPNKINRFWKIMAKIAESQLREFHGVEAVNERKSLMKKLKVGIHDVGKVIEREDRSASDDKIKILEFMDLLTIIENSSSLKSILLTGYSGKTSSYGDFIQYLEKHSIEYTYPKEVKGGEKFTITVNEKVIVVFIGNSTSTAARRITDEMLVKQFREAMLLGNED